MSARCALPGQTLSIGIAAARVGHHLIPAYAPRRAGQVDAGSRRHKSQSAGHDIDCYNTLDI